MWPVQYQKVLLVLFVVCIVHCTRLTNESICYTHTSADTVAAPVVKFRASKVKVGELSVYLSGCMTGQVVCTADEQEAVAVVSVLFDLCKFSAEFNTDVCTLLLIAVHIMCTCSWCKRATTRSCPSPTPTSTLPPPPSTLTAVAVDTAVEGLRRVCSQEAARRAPGGTGQDASSTSSAR